MAQDYLGDVKQLLIQSIYTSNKKLQKFKLQIICNRTHNGHSSLYHCYFYGKCMSYTYLRTFKNWFI